MKRNGKIGMNLKWEKEMKKKGYEEKRWLKIQLNNIIIIKENIF